MGGELEPRLPLSQRNARSPKSEDLTIAAFRDAPEDDEPVTAVDEEALAEVQAHRAADVPRISFAEMKRKHGYP